MSLIRKHAADRWLIDGWVQSDPLPPPLAGGGLRKSADQSSVQSRINNELRAVCLRFLSSWVIKTYKDEDSAAFQGNLFKG